MELDFEKLKVQGVKINYYYICKRKLWLFDKGITMEQNSDRVLSGKLIHEKSYPRLKNKEVMIDDILKLDIMQGEYIKETKISSKMPKADKMQLIYYLYYLKKLGIIKKGIINYVKEKRQEELELTKEEEINIEKTLIEINKITKMKHPPKLEKLLICTKCAYYEFCFAKEE
ncbi:CRISPR-associated protein Cas4 [Tepidibacter thalassicus]|uniref:CRISPR-associated exonuclease Cas4 n=1 Tax=Tepidibacter thalassicus DSM 15285 TaxID=1123350 RepID=A0A1M5PUT8_9FIRM|nr:CRISPR-associated protein Cas4 [Tepidibacter thalassicus]SHH05420.1 CRISPR-associated exonuclease Cas4 [Tepidibacter thalassicus DSM 15285]